MGRAVKQIMPLEIVAFTVNFGMVGDTSGYCGMNILFDAIVVLLFLNLVDVRV